jgi:hypothetical protein
MICKIQVVTLGEDGREEVREIACLERTDLKPETLGLTLAEGKVILKGLQAIVVEGQLHPFSGWLSFWCVAAMAEPALGVLGANGLEPRVNGGFQRLARAGPHPA